MTVPTATLNARIAIPPIKTPAARTQTKGGIRNCESGETLLSKKMLLFNHKKGHLKSTKLVPGGSSKIGMYTNGNTNRMPIPDSIFVDQPVSQKY